MSGTYPIKAVFFNASETHQFWWPVTSDSDDEMIVGDGIPGDKKTAEFAARCCNIVYAYAVSDVMKELDGIIAPELKEKIRKNLLKKDHDLFQSR